MVLVVVYVTVCRVNGRQDNRLNWIKTVVAVNRAETEIEMDEWRRQEGGSRSRGVVGRVW